MKTEDAIKNCQDGLNTLIDFMDQAPADETTVNLSLEILKGVHDTLANEFQTAKSSQKMLDALARLDQTIKARRAPEAPLVTVPEAGNA